MGFAVFSASSRAECKKTFARVGTDFVEMFSDSKDYIALYAKTAWNFRKLKPIYSELSRKNFFYSETYSGAERRVLNNGGFILPAGLATLGCFWVPEFVDSQLAKSAIKFVFFSSITVFTFWIPIHTRFAALETLREGMGDEKFVAFAHSWDSRTSA